MYVKAGGLWKMLYKQYLAHVTQTKRAKFRIFMKYKTEKFANSLFVLGAKTSRKNSETSRFKMLHCYSPLCAFGSYTVQIFLHLIES